MNKIIIVLTLLSLCLKGEIIFSFDKDFHADKGGVPLQDDITGIEKTGVHGVPLSAAAGIAENERFGTGVSGKALKIGVASEGKGRYAYQYKPFDGLYTNEGCIMFWAKPENWNGGDDRFHILFCASSDTPPGYTMFIYKYQNRPELFFYLNGIYAFTSVKDWTPGEWHHVAAAWKSDELYLYVDGRLKNGIKTKPRAREKFKSFSFGPSWEWSKETGTTLLDTVRITPKFQDEHSVSQEYSLTAALLKGGKSTIEIMVHPTTPTIDGTISEGEYGFYGSGFFNIMNGKYANKQNRWGIAYDKQNLYFAMASPVEGEMTAKHHDHDANIWEDDSVEIHIRTAEHTNYQFIFNSGDGIFDKMNDDRTWNSQGVKTSSRIENEIWTFEAAMPLSNFKPLGDHFFINLCRSFAHPKELTAAAPVNFSYTDYNNFIRINPDANAPLFELASIGNLNDRKLNLKLKLHNMEQSENSFRVSLSTDNQILPFQKVVSILVPPSEAKVLEENNSNLPANATLAMTLEDKSGKRLYSAKFPYHDITPAVIHSLYVKIPKQTMFLSVKNHTPGLKKALKISIQDKAKQVVLTAQKDVPPNSYSELPFDIANLPQGSYTVFAELLDTSGNVLNSNNFPMNKSGDKPWWSNPHTGLENDVPPPWTTPVATDNEFQCWGRTYRFKNGSFIASINIDGTEFLYSPVRLLVNGTNADFRTERLDGKRSPAVNDYRQTAVRDGIVITSELQAEYDGLLRFTLIVRPEDSSAELSSMSLEIPIAAQCASGFNDCSSIFENDDLRKSRGKTIFKNPVYKPFFRIGNERIGLLGGMSSMRGWHTKDKEHALAIDNQTDKAKVSLSFVDTPFRLEKERRISFYLQATPVKPKAPISKTRKAHLWTGYWTTVFDYKVEGFFDDTAIQSLEKQLKPDMEYHWYFTSSGASPFSPEWYYWGLDWHNDPPSLGSFGADSDMSNRAKRDKNAWTYGCLSSRSFLDFKIRTCTDAITNPKYHVDNCYFDLSWPKICWNPEHECLWLDDFGDKMPTNDWEGNREFHERIYRTLKRKNPDGAITQHLIATWTPGDSFCDIIVGGEAYDQEIASKENYYDCFKPDFMRIAYTPRNVDKDYRIIPQFLRSFLLFKPARAKTWKPDSPDARKAILHMLGCLYVHNINCWPIYGTEGFVVKARKYRNLLTDTNYSFHPYWEKNGPVTHITPENDNLMASVYEHGGKYLLAVLNNSTTPCTAQIHLQGMDTLPCLEVFSDEKTALNAGVLNVPLADREFKLFFFGDAD